MHLLTKKKKNYRIRTTHQALLWTQDTEVSNIVWWELGIHPRSFLECAKSISPTPCRYYCFTLSGDNDQTLGEQN